MEEKYNDNDTIAAISTALGPGGINIIRITGPKAIEVSDKVFSAATGQKLEETSSHRLVYGKIIDSKDDTEVDEVLVSVLRAPKTYTREDTVEINCHGGIRAATDVLDLVLSSGARMAEPGEFTKRAFFNGRIDLAQAEAVADMIMARTSAGMRSAYRQLSGRLSAMINGIRKQLLEIQANLEATIDWPEDDLSTMAPETIAEVLAETAGSIRKLQSEAERSMLLQEGITAAIIGRPNVGKSSLLNLMVGHDKAIVTAQPGTTRDIVEAAISVKGYPVLLKDTAGIREARDDIEKIGIERSMETANKSSINLFMVDGSAELQGNDISIAADLDAERTILIINKSDLKSCISEGDGQKLLGNAATVRISSLTGDGMEQLEDELEKKILASTIDEHMGEAIGSMRHISSLRRALSAAEEARSTLKAGEAEEVTAILVAESYRALGEIIGESVTSDLLDKIFESFCIGK